MSRLGNTQELAGEPFEDLFTDVRIWSTFEGSDHAPVWADLQLPGSFRKGERPPALSLANRRTGATAGAHYEAFLNLLGSLCSLVCKLGV